MRTEVFDRLLEHVLREELAAAPPALDLTARVATALATRTTWVARRPAGARVSSRTVPLWLPIAIVAATVAVALTWLAARQPGLTCSRELLVAADAHLPFAPSANVDSPAHVWCTGDAGAALVAGDGTAAAVAPGCAFAIDPRLRSVELLAGTFELAARGAPWRIDVDDVGVLVAGGCTVRCTLTPDTLPPTEPPEPTMTANDLRARLRDLSAPLTLTVLVLAGTADVATAQGPQRVVAGSSRTVEIGDEKAANARALELYQDVRKELPSGTDEASTAAAKDLQSHFRELIGLVVQRPAAFGALRPAIAQDLVGGRLAAEARGRVVQLALLDEEARMFGLASRTWAAQPEAFGLEEQIALAERGFEPAKTKLRESLANVSGPRIARPLAALACGGDETARTAVARFLRADVADAPKDLDRFDARCHVAAALQTLGDPAPMRELRAALVSQVETWVASGEKQQLAFADRCLHRAEYWLGSQQPRLSWPEIRQHAGTPRRGEPDAASLRARAAALAK